MEDNCSVHKICVLGLGYIGLPTAALLATNGFAVVGVDVNPAVVDVVNRAAVPIAEPGLATVLKAAVHSGNLVARSEAEPADASEVKLVALGAQ
ncbi:MAG: hypothetical protein D9V47_01705 [Clostridia bacterium]|nr:MAG: hypothetical protein D9V47_01705 [Clostridia bacterium]